MGFVQKKYLELSAELDCKGYRALEKTYYHPHWENAKKDIKELILGSSPKGFFNIAGNKKQIW